MSWGVKEKLNFCNRVDSTVNIYGAVTSMAKLQHEQVQKGEQAS